MSDKRKVGRYTPHIERPDLVEKALAMGLPNPVASFHEGGWWVSTMSDTGATAIYAVQRDGSLQKLSKGRPPRNGGGQ